jgi:hypothetical protein
MPPSLLDAALAALDAFTAERLHGETPSTPHAATEFVTFKLYAMVDCAQRLRDQMAEPLATASIVDGVPRFAVKRAEKFVLFVLLDSFLFQTASVKEAILQLVNDAFQLGYPIDKGGLADEVRNRLTVSTESTTGLEPWLVQATEPPWLHRALELRHITTHRRVLRIPEYFTWAADAATQWKSEVVIEGTPEGFESLTDFVDHTEARMLTLVGATLERLAPALRAWRARS